MEAFRLLIELYEVDGYEACATSAMRNSENGLLLTQLVEEKIGLPIRIIDGEEEAEIIAATLQHILPPGLCLHVDVGGGSTELNYYENGNKLASASFNLGSVRLLQGVATHDTWESMRNWIKKHLPKGHPPVTALGTGGNISKLFSYSGKKPGKTVSLQKLRKLRDWMEEYSLEERIHLLNMNPDRADVILPASEIYLKAMEWSGARNMLVPDLGLKDGIIYKLYQQQTEKAGV
jgi:exopolyphosphatase/guanosine-5'-triphosphate,3'-diphosphate pyrophosphatase